MEDRDKEKAILQCWLDAWGDEYSERKLPGYICYRDVDNLRIKLGLESPKGLTEIMDGTFEKQMRELTKKYRL